MEAHHPHHVAHKKKWTEYLLEFFMLFFAVFLGFVAENIREHSVERSHEKEYIISFINDLKTDSEKITRGSIRFDNIVKACDTVLTNYEVITKKYSPLIARPLNYILSGYPGFIYTDRTMQQLKNAGGLRLITNKSASDSIIGYDDDVRNAVINESLVTILFEEMQNYSFKDFNFREIDNESKKVIEDITIPADKFWLTRDRAEVEQLYNLLRKYSSVIFYYNKYLNRLKAHGIRLIKILKKEYKL